MAPPTPPNHILPALAILTCLLTTFAAAQTSPPNQNRSTECPVDDADLQTIVYSPFTPYFKGIPNATSVQQCWLWASCALDNADPARAQQFGAVALVMGLIPLTFKDIAWPGRRVVRLSVKLPWAWEVGVRALGLEPRYPEKGGDVAAQLGQTREEWAGSTLARKVVRPGWWIGGMGMLLVATGAGLALIEIYSKRASLGCVYPVFVLSWFVIALLPAVVHRVCYDIRTRGPTQGEPETPGVRSRRESVSRSDASAVQGSDEIWLVQLMWAIYYIAGTLIYTSIMAVTVAELTAWVGFSALFTASCKFMAFFVCLHWEKRQQKKQASLLGTPVQWQTVRPSTKPDDGPRMP